MFPTYVLKSCPMQRAWNTQTYCSCSQPLCPDALPLALAGVGGLYIHVYIIIPMTDPWCCYIWCSMDPIVAGISLASQRPMAPKEVNLYKWIRRSDRWWGEWMVQQWMVIPCGYYYSNSVNPWLISYEWLIMVIYIYINGYFLELL